MLALEMFRVRYNYRTRGAALRAILDVVLETEKNTITRQGEYKQIGSKNGETT